MRGEQGAAPSAQHPLEYLPEAVLAAAPDWVYVADVTTGALRYASPRIAAALGIDPGALGAGSRPTLMDAVHHFDRDLLRECLAEAVDMQDDEARLLRFRCADADGQVRWLSQRIAPFRRRPDGTVSEVVGVVRDVSEIVAAEERVAHSALHDPLTGLPNRQLLLDRIGQAMSRSNRGAGQLALLYVDLDGFKRINDSIGHAAGDSVLCTMAHRLRGAVRAVDTVARLGGDEFVVLVEPSEHLSTGSDPGPVVRDGETVEELASRLIAAVSPPLEFDGHQLGVTASIGISFPRPGLEPERALEDADAAMYRAKQRGRARYEIFDPELRWDLQRRVVVEHDLRSALADRLGDPVATAVGPMAFGLPRARSGEVARLDVHYQAIVDQQGATVGFEALCRLTGHDGTAVPPSVFIPVAEETGQIRPLGSWVMTAALRQLRAWRDAGAHAGQYVSVNVSAVEVADPRFADRVRAAVAATHVLPGDLVLELTESTLLQAAHSTLDALRSLADFGVRIAIDDFGTGYASLQYLTQLPVSCIKIDASFTTALTVSPAAAAIVRAITALAEDLDLGCVVEGVETAEQQRAVSGAAHMQGYLFSRPQPASQIGVSRAPVRG